MARVEEWAREVEGESITSAQSLQAKGDALTWARLAVICGPVAFVAYALFAADLSLLPVLIAICTFGPAMAVSSAGVYEVLRLHRPTVSLKIGLGANIAAAIAVTMGLLAQVGSRELLELRFGADPAAGAGSPAYQAGNGIQLGFDMAWDLFLIIGTFLLALNMWSHPRFGRSYALMGGFLGIALMAFNLATFPEPPGHGQLVDLGPLVGLWYVIVTIRIAFSLAWVQTKIVQPLEPERR